MYKIEQNFNENYHSSIKNTPNNIFYGKDKIIPEETNKFQRLKIGDKVRLLEKN